MRKYTLPFEVMGFDKLVDEITPEIQDTLNQMAESIAVTAYGKGTDYVNQKLHKTRLDYQNHFHYKKVDASNHEIWLDKEAEHLEDGYQRFDMKPGILKGPKAKVSKKGVRYNTIPFKQASPGAATNLREQLMGEQMKQALKSGISRLTRQKTDLNKIQKGADGKPLRGNVGKISKNPIIHPHLQGLTRYQKQYGGATQAQSMTFRTVTSKSDPASWWHPGYDGVHAFREMEKYVNDEFNRLISESKSDF